MSEAIATDHEGTSRFLPNGPWGTVSNAAVARSPALIYGSEHAPVTVRALTITSAQSIAVTSIMRAILTVRVARAASRYLEITSSSEQSWRLATCAAQQRHRLRDQLRAQVVRKRPADYTPAERVKNACQLQLALHVGT